MRLKATKEASAGSSVYYKNHNKSVKLDAFYKQIALIIFMFDGVNFELKLCSVVWKIARNLNFLLGRSNRQYDTSVTHGHGQVFPL